MENKTEYWLGRFNNGVVEEFVITPVKEVARHYENLGFSMGSEDNNHLKNLQKEFSYLPITKINSIDEIDRRK